MANKKAPNSKKIDKPRKQSAEIDALAENENSDAPAGEALPDIENSAVPPMETTPYPHDKVRLSTDTIAKIIDVHRILDRLFRHYFAQYNITSVQIPVLMALVGQDKIMVSRLASLLHIGSSNITPLCKRLEKSGLITRTRDTEDQRVVFVSLTQTAIDLMETISRSIRTLNDRENDEYAMSDEDAAIICEGVDVLYKYTANLLINETGSIID